MKKIVVTKDLNLSPEEKERLNKLGKVEYYNDLAKTPEEWLKRCEGADIICTGIFGLKQKVYELENIFISLPFVGVGFLDLDKLKSRNIKISNSPGCNTEAVSEWIMAMILNLLLQLPKYINNLNSKFEESKINKSLSGKNISILGKGHIGSRVGMIAEKFEMNVKYFMRGDNLMESIKDADVIVNTLSLNQSTIGLLDKKFFNFLKKDSYFVTITALEIYDTEAMLEALEKNILAGVATDCGSIQVGNVQDPFYIKMIEHPKILATPHIAYNTDVERRKANKMMIDNIEAYLNSKPINLI